MINLIAAQGQLVLETGFEHDSQISPVWPSTCLLSSLHLLDLLNPCGLYLWTCWAIRQDRHLCAKAEATRPCIGPVCRQQLCTMRMNFLVETFGPQWPEAESAGPQGSATACSLEVKSTLHGRMDHGCSMPRRRKPSKLAGSYIRSSHASVPAEPRRARGLTARVSVTRPLTRSLALKRACAAGADPRPRPEEDQYLYSAAHIGKQPL